MNTPDDKEEPRVLKPRVIKKQEPPEPKLDTEDMADKMMNALNSNESEAMMAIDPAGGPDEATMVVYDENGILRTTEALPV